MPTVYPRARFFVARNGFVWEKAPPLGDSREDLDLRRAVFARDDCTCHWCGRHVTFLRVTRKRPRYAPRRATIDHVLPRCRGGQNHPLNLVTSCKECNDRRGFRG